MVAGREEETIEIERALARALPRLFFKRLLFSAEMWRSLRFRVTFSVSIFELSRMPSVWGGSCDKQQMQRMRAIGNATSKRLSLSYNNRRHSVISEINSDFLIRVNPRISGTVDGLLATDPNAGPNKSCRLSLVCREHSEGCSGGVLTARMTPPVDGTRWPFKSSHHLRQEAFMRLQGEELYLAR